MYKEAALRYARERASWSLSQVSFDVNSSLLTHSAYFRYAKERASRCLHQISFYMDRSLFTWIGLFYRSFVPKGLFYRSCVPKGLCSLHVPRVCEKDSK